MRRSLLMLLLAALAAGGCATPDPLDRTVTFAGPDGPGPAGFVAAAEVQAAVASDGSVTGVVTISGARLLAFDARNDADDPTIVIELDSGGLAARSTMTRDAAASVFDRPRPTMTTDAAGLVSAADDAGLRLLGCGIAWAVTGITGIAGCDLDGPDAGPFAAEADGVSLTARTEASGSDRPESLFTIDDDGAVELTAFIGTFEQASVPDVVLLGDPAAIAATVAQGGAGQVPPQGVTVTVFPDGSVQADAADSSACSRDGEVRPGACG